MSRKPDLETFLDCFQDVSSLIAVIIFAAAVVIYTFALMG